MVMVMDTDRTASGSADGPLETSNRALASIDPVAVPQGNNCGAGGAGAGQGTAQAAGTTKRTATAATDGKQLVFVDFEPNVVEKNYECKF